MHFWMKIHILLLSLLSPLALAEDIVDPVEVLKVSSQAPQQQSLRGLLSLYWQHDTLQLALQPSLAAQERLWKNTAKPQALTHARQDMNFINLHWQGSEEALRQQVLQQFGQVSETFWSAKRGVLHLPALVNIQKFQLTSADCDSYYFEAQLLALKRDQKSDAKPIYAVSCANGLELNRVTVKSKDGYANFRSSHSASAQILQRLNNGTELIELDQSGMWLQVQLPQKDHNHPPAIGYVHKSQVIVEEVE